MYQVDLLTEGTAPAESTQPALIPHNPATAMPTRTSGILMKGP